MTAASLLTPLHELKVQVHKGRTAPSAYDRVRADTTFTGQAVDANSRIIGNHPAYPPLLASLAVKGLGFALPDVARRIEAEHARSGC